MYSYFCVFTILLFCLQILRKYWPLWLVLCTAAVHFLPYLLLGRGSYVRIHDSLEGEWVWYETLWKTGLAWDFNPKTIIEPILGGLPRYCSHSGLSLINIWLWLFGPFWGYVANYVFLHVLSFVGMFYFLKGHVLKEKEELYINVVVSLCFSWIPFYSTFGATVAGQPLLLAILLDIRKGQPRWWHWLVLCLFPFYSSIVWAAPYIVAASAGIFVWQLWNFKEWNWRLAIAPVLLSVLYLVANYNLLYTTYIDKAFISHRAEYDYFFDSELSIGKGLADFTMLFFIGHYHVGSFVSIPILAAIVSALYENRDLPWQTRRLLFTIIGVCFFFGFYGYVVYAFGDTIRLLPELKFNRISILLPLTWLILLAFLLRHVNARRTFSQTVIAFLVCQFLVGMFANDEWIHNVRHLTGFVKKPSYESFFAEKQFQQIADSIGLDKSEYKVASLGINAAVAQHNGFYTLDGLQAVYPLKHKHDFRPLIAGELAKNQALGNYFDKWGNRCYLFSDELGFTVNDFLIFKWEPVRTVQNWAFDAEAFKRIGGKYVFSAVEIKNAPAIHLRLKNVFESPESCWKVWLYEAELVVQKM